jgi:hypothetical protein
MDEQSPPDIGIVMTRSESGDEVSIFMKSLNGKLIDVEDVIHILSQLDIKSAMTQMSHDRLNVHPMPKGTM